MNNLQNLGFVFDPVRAVRIPDLNPFEPQITGCEYCAEFLNYI